MKRSYTLSGHIINHIKPVINAVLSLVNSKILDIPCNSTNSFLTTEMGVLGHNELKEQ